MSMRSIVRKIRKALTAYEPLIDISISRENLLHNLHTYQKHHPSVSFAPILKSNAYGHGLCVVAEILDKEDIAFFGVDSLYEAKTLRRGGIKSKILLIGYVRPEYIAHSALSNIDYGIVDIEQLRELVHIARIPVRIHLKLDTGMHRQGILPKDLDDALMLIASNPHVKLVGVFSHFADADSKDRTHTDKQIAVWKEMLSRIEEKFPDLQYKHIAATKGIPRTQDVGANVARLGIGLYGYDTSPQGAADLKGALEMRASIVSIRDVPVGDFVGYNATFIASRPSRIATVPAGYFEGVNRRLSGKGSFTVRGVPCPIAGRVSMNMTSIDVTDLPEAARGDTVTVISRDRNAANSVEKLAELADTTPYVILAGIPQHLRRVVE